MRKAVFIDKDGTLIANVPYNADPALINLEEGASMGLQLLQAHGFALVVASNQSGVAQGYFEEKQLERVYEKITQLLPVQLDGFFYCPHLPNGDCTCRKPKPGLLLEAAAQLQIDLAASWMIGDILNDVEAGNRAGCRTVLINNGGETEWLLTPMRVPTFVASDLLDAAAFIIANTHQNK
ncbi:D-glycero-alpha-D-manno-heptose-1,7-bisphosphate 7-phosphatase [Chitinophaga lutea]